MLIGLIILLLILCLFFLKYRPNHDDFIIIPSKLKQIRYNTIIPKVIWTYWHDLSNIPNLVTKCIDTWIIHNYDYEINILDDYKFKKLTGIDINEVFSITNTKTHQKKSDFIRLTLIYRFGGIWMDASIICLKPLDWIHDIKNSEFIGFLVADDGDPIIESWFLAAVPKSTLLYDWLEEFNQSLQYKLEMDYCNDIMSEYPVPNHLRRMLPYLTIHLCNWLLLFLDPTRYKVYFMSSIENGPLFYMKTFRYNFYKTCDDIRKKGVPRDLKLLKIINAFRTAILNRKRTYNTDNKYINYVFDNGYKFYITQ